jgi:hypothetical protein
MDLSPRHETRSNPYALPTVTPSPSTEKKLIQLNFQRSFLCRGRSGETSDSILTSIDTNDSLSFPDAREINKVPPPCTTSRNSLVYSDEKSPSLSYMKPPCASRRSSTESYLVNMALPPSAFPFPPTTLTSVTEKKIGSDRNESISRPFLFRGWSGESGVSILTSIDTNDSLLFPADCENNEISPSCIKSRNSFIHPDEKPPSLPYVKKPPCASRRSSIESYLVNMALSPNAVPFPPSTLGSVMERKIVQETFGSESIPGSFLSRGWSGESGVSILTSIDTNDSLLFPADCENNEVPPSCITSRNSLIHPDEKLSSQPYVMKPPCASRRSSIEPYLVNMALSPNAVPFPPTTLASVMERKIVQETFGSESIPRPCLSRGWSCESGVSILTSIDTNDSLLFPADCEKNEVPPSCIKSRNSFIHPDEKLPSLPHVKKPPCASRRSSIESYLVNMALSPSAVPFPPTTLASVMERKIVQETFRSESIPRSFLSRGWSGESGVSILTSIDTNDSLLFPADCENNEVPPSCITSRNSFIHRNERTPVLQCMKPVFNMVPPPFFPPPFENLTVKSENELFQSVGSALSTHSWIGVSQLTTETVHFDRTDVPLHENNVFPTIAMFQDCKPSHKNRSARRRHDESIEEKIYVGSGYEDTDVVCGKGESVNRHIGHKLFHLEKERLQGRYLRTVARKEKAEIARELVQTMVEKYHSRFLDFCREKGQWYVISDKRALDKAKQVLRESFSAEQRKLKRLQYYKPKK